MHPRALISCVDCHGGDPTVAFAKSDLSEGSMNFLEAKRRAHVAPKNPALWPTAGNPLAPAAATQSESIDFIRFVNPGDLRAAPAACGPCHNTEKENFIVDRVTSSMMAHGAMLWGAALYNNGAIDRKISTFAEAYTPDGTPARMRATSQPTTQQAQKGVLAQLWPLGRWEITQPGNVLRVFERGGLRRPQIGLIDPTEEAGKPDVKLSIRGFGTDVRTDPVFLGLQKTRLLDPTLNLFGTNDQAGDYRSSGCTACHVVYANDANPVHSGRWAKYGNRGESFSADLTVNPSATTQPSANGWDRESRAREAGHPIKHEFVKNMPTSTCIVCHVHPGTTVTNSFLGYMWWDNESDGQLMYPKTQRYPSTDDEFNISIHNPEQAAARGLWGDRKFLEKTGTPDFNEKLQHNQFGDFHGHGWVFRKVFKLDRHGNLLDKEGKVVSFTDADRFRKTVHLQDVHLEKGMHCIDCHFEQDSHGNGLLYGETRNAVMIDCIDCHGTAVQPAKLLSYFRIDRAPLLGRPDQKRKAAEQKKLKLDELQPHLFSGNTSPADRNYALNNAIGHFDLKEGRLWQKSALDEKAGWFVSQTAELKANSDDKDGDSILAQEQVDAAKYAHTVRRGTDSANNQLWGGDPSKDQTSPEMMLAHADTRVSCYACHTSWNTSCFGCHLPMRANQRKPMLHNEGAMTRNYTNYNFQTLRDDVYMLGVDSTARNNKIVPIRSACAVLVSSQDANRQWIYEQQQTISAEGYSGTAFSPYFPHTVRGKETKQCADCHIHRDENGLVDNNAIMAQLFLQGTNAVNFIGRFAWVATGDGGVEAVAVTERDEPQAVIGSRLHETAYPDYFKAHLARGMQLAESHEHHGSVLDVQLRGEYLYSACGANGFIAYDVANIDNKGFSERFLTAPVSPLGQRFYVKSKFATSICSPSTMAIDPTRKRRDENLEGRITEIGDPDNIIEESKPIHPLYAYLYLTDAKEGLIVIGNPENSKNGAGVSTLLDGDPNNNFLQRALTFNPNGILRGARHMSLSGTHGWISCDAGIVIIDFDNPLEPRIVATIDSSQVNQPRRVQFQFRYAFVLDADGLKVFDNTNPEAPQLVSGASVAIDDARDLYITRTYGYVAAGRNGLVILDLERPERPKINQVFDADGKLNDSMAVKVGMTNTSLFAYVADGKNGLRVIQLTSPDDTPTYAGFSPRPAPRLIAQHKTHGRALAVSEGLDRDRAVDEAGNQLSVFGRRGARPLTLAEQQKLYLRKGADGVTKQFTVSGKPTTQPISP